MQFLQRERDALVIYEGTREAGVYRLTTPEKQTVYYVVPIGRPRVGPDAVRRARTATKVAKLTGVRYATDRQAVIRGCGQGVQRQETWWILLVGLLGLLCMEVWMTRRVVRGR